MSEDRKIDWQAPDFRSDPTGETRKAWIEEQIQESEGWMEGQTAYKNISRNLNIFDGIFEDKSKSFLVSNGLKYDLRKFVETISEVREIGSYSSDAPQFKSSAEILNKVAKGIYLEAQFPRQIRKALQFGMLGRGYIWPKCKAEDYGFGERKIVFEPLGMLDVLPVQIPSSNDVQDAYACTIYEYMPIAEAHGRFPLFQSELQPVTAVSYKSRLSARRADYAERFRYGDIQRNWGNLYCEIRYTFIRDIRINSPKFGMGFELPMGDPNTSWFYKVPYVGQEIFGGIRNGQRFMRPARPEDCRIYPFLRLMISTANMKRPMYDGPAFDWHGKIPAIQYDPDDWAWEALGRSLIQDVGSIEQTIRKMERKMDQVIGTSLNPPLGYDNTTTGGPKIENFDIFGEDVRAGLAGEPKKVLQSLLPEGVEVRDIHFKFLEWLVQSRQNQLGIADLSALAKLKLNMSSDNFESLLESDGPIAKGIAGGMEASNAKIAYMLKFMIPQWYDTRRIIDYTGPKPLQKEEFLDFDPNSLIPAHMPDEYVNGLEPQSLSAYPKIERARSFARNLRLVSVPSTLLELTQKQEQLKWMTLKKQGAPISWCTTLKKLGIENYGDVPGDTEREKWQNEELDMLKFKAEAAKFGMALGLQPEGGAGQGKGGGRPNSNKKPANLKQKGGRGGEPRTVMTTS